MSEELRKLAAALRTQAVADAAAKEVKIARVVQAAVGLKHFSRLLGR
jgi:hypothetical protein